MRRGYYSVLRNRNDRMYTPENIPHTPLHEDIRFDPTGDEAQQSWIKGRAARLAATTVLASVALIGVSAETETTTTSNGSTGQISASCAYKPASRHLARSTSANTAKVIGKDMITHCFGASQWPAAEELWDNESDWKPTAINKSSGACGIVQAAPCNKLTNNIYATSVEEQLSWGIDYIDDRYGTPYKALQFWKERHRINGKDVGNWY